MVKLLYSFTTVKLLGNGHVFALVTVLMVQNAVHALPAKEGTNARSLEEVGSGGESNNIHSEEENQVTPTNGLKVTVYPWNNHLGRPATMEWSLDEVNSQSCKEIPSRWQKKVRSVNTHDSCVVLFTGFKCDGIGKTLKVGSPSHNRLSDICFQRKPMSARPCTKEELEAPITDRV